MDKGFQKEAVGKDAHEKIVRSCDRCEGGVHAKKRESIPFVKRRKRGGERVCKGAIKERIHLAIQVTTNGTSVLCRKEEWKKKNGTRLSVS